MRPIVWIQDSENRLNAAIAVVVLILVIEGLSFVRPILRPRDTPREKSQKTQTVIVPRSLEPDVFVQKTPSTRLHTDETSFQVCLASTPAECPPARVFVRCGGDTLRKWMERQCGRSEIEGQLPIGVGGHCERSLVRVRCTSPAL